MAHLGVGKSGVEAINTRQSKEEALILSALRETFQRIDTDGGGTLDQEEIAQIFSENKIDVTDIELSVLMQRAANGTTSNAAYVRKETHDQEPGKGLDEVALDFDQFSVWMQSSDSLADKLRQAIGGTLEDKLDRHALGVEERTVGHNVRMIALLY